MIKGTVIFFSGVATGVTVCAFAVRYGITVTSRELTEVLHRALSPEDAKRVREEFSFKLIEMDVRSEVTPKQRRISRTISGFLVPQHTTKE